MNKRQSVFSIFLVLAGISLLGIIVMYLLAYQELASLLVLAFFGFLLIGMQDLDH